jgi:hypothetical protein
MIVIDDIKSTSKRRSAALSVPLAPLAQLLSAYPQHPCWDFPNSSKARAGRRLRKKSARAIADSLMAPDDSGRTMARRSLIFFSTWSRRSAKKKLGCGQGNPSNLHDSK